LIGHATQRINGLSAFALRPVILPVAGHCRRCRLPAEVDYRPDGPRFDFGPTTVVRYVQGNLHVQLAWNEFWTRTVQFLRAHFSVCVVRHGSDRAPQHEDFGRRTVCRVKPLRTETSTERIPDNLLRSVSVIANPFCRGISISPMTRSGCNFAASYRVPTWWLYSRCERMEKSSAD